MSRQAKIITEAMGAIENFQAVETGCFTIQIDGSVSTENIVDLDFSGVSNYDDVAAIVQSKIRAVGVGGYTLATVTASAPTGDDVTLTITSGTTAYGAYIASLFSPFHLTDPAVDVAGVDFLNGRKAKTRLTFGIYLMDALNDIPSIQQNNSTHEYTLSVMDFYKVDTNTQTGACIECDVVEMTEYQDWYTSLDAIRPFSTRVLHTITIDNR